MIPKDDLPAESALALLVTASLSALTRTNLRGCYN
jgi:hypothetical protein